MAVAHGAAPSLRSSTWGPALDRPDVPNDAVSDLCVSSALFVTADTRRASQTAVVPRTQATPVAPGVLWLAGDEVPSRAWVLRYARRRRGPRMFRSTKSPTGSPSLPLIVHLEEAHVVNGVVVDARGSAGNSALIAFRLIDPLPSSSTQSRDKPRRVLAAETVADRDGAFHLDGIGEADYEFGGAGPPRPPRRSSPPPARSHHHGKAPVFPGRASPPFRSTHHLAPANASG